MLNNWRLLQITSVVSVGLQLYCYVVILHSSTIHKIEISCSQGE